MNPKSIFKKELLSHKLKNNKKFIVNNSSLDKKDNIFIESPILSNKKVKSNTNIVNYYLDELKQTITINNNNIIHLCIYTIEIKSVNPFLLYLLYKHDNDLLTFPYFIYNGGDVKQISVEKIKSILDCAFHFKGFLKDGENIFMFYELERCYEPCLLEKKDSWWFSLIYEICYLKKVNNFIIDNVVSNLFFKNKYLTLLYDDNSISHEVPVPLYNGSNKEKLNYLVAFGTSKSISTNYLESEFYNYYSYENACRFGLWTKDFKPNDPLTDNKFGRFNQGGIVRYASFLGQTKIINEDDLEKNINDISKWTLNFDSFFIGNVKLEDEQYHLGYKYSLKNNNQIYPLSFHLLDKTNVDSMYDYKKKYEII